MFKHSLPSEIPTRNVSFGRWIGTSYAYLENHVITSNKFIEDSSITSGGDISRDDGQIQDAPLVLSTMWVMGRNTSI